MEDIKELVDDETVELFKGISEKIKENPGDILKMMSQETDEKEKAELAKNILGSEEGMKKMCSGIFSMISKLPNIVKPMLEGSQLGESIDFESLEHTCGELAKSVYEKGPGVKSETEDED